MNPFSFFYYQLRISMAYEKNEVVVFFPFSNPYFRETPPD